MPSRTPRPAPPRPAAAADLDDAGKQVLRQFRQVYNAVRTHFQKVEKIVGLGGSMVWALSLVRDRPGIGVRGLAEAMAVHQSTASNLVRGLLDRQLISAAKDGPDRRTVQLRLLPAGAKLLRGMPGPAAGVLPAALEALDGETLLRLRDDLARLVALLGADERGASIPLSDL